MSTGSAEGRQSRMEKDIARQCGILPFRRTANGLEVLLVTSSTRKRWIIPKGNVEPHLSVLESARKEAYEEAGIKGKVRTVPFGSYLHESPSGPSQVQVYLMEVVDELSSWPEHGERDRIWMSVREAHDRVLEPGLKQLLIQLVEEVD